MKIVIIEPGSGGHRALYATWMARALAEAGSQVTLVTGGDISDMNPDDARDNYRLSREVVPFRRPDVKGALHFSGLIQKKFRLWRYFKFALEAVDANRAADLIFVPYLDHFDELVPLLGSPFRGTAWAGLKMRARFHMLGQGVRVEPRPLDRISGWAFHNLMAREDVRLLMTSDPTLAAYVNQSSSRSRLAYLPEPAMFTKLVDRTDARLALGLRHNRHYLLVYGALTLRKGLAKLLSAVTSPHLRESCDVILAGRQDENFRREFTAWIRSNPDMKYRFRVFDRFVDSLEEQYLYSAVDAVWINYDRFAYSSGVFTQARQVGVPIVASDYGLVGWHSRHYEYAYVVPQERDYDIGRVVDMAIGETPHCRKRDKGSPAGDSHALGYVKEYFASLLLNA